MKTIALLSISAALVFAQDASKDAQVQSKAQSKDQAKDQKAAAPAKAKNVPAIAQRKNLHRPGVTPTPPVLTPAQKAAAALPKLPEGATEVGPNLFRYTDPQGKTWMYRNTPFGYSKWEEKPGDRQPSTERAAPAPATVTDLGDSIQFERATPFGPQKWTRKKSELTEEEKATVAAFGKAAPEKQ